MKLKQSPEDFYVVELTDVQSDAVGDFAFYSLEKSGWNTNDAMAVIRKRWRLTPRRISFGGLKDRHALTLQHFTILHGPTRHLSQQGLKVRYLGKTAAPFTSNLIRGNRFRIAVRDMSPEVVENLLAQLDDVRRDGVPNYFDDQRFGSVSGHRFVAQPLVLGQYEDALRLSLTEPYAHDRAAAKREKAVLRKHWNEWTRCRDQVPRGPSRAVIDHLIEQPSDFAGAVLKLRPELRTLYLAAYQSHLWNRILAKWLRAQLAPSPLGTLRLSLSEVPIYRSLTDQQRLSLQAVQLPLPSRIALDEVDPRRPMVEEVLAEESISTEHLALRGLRGVFFSKGERLVLSVPQDLALEVIDDAANTKTRSIALNFTLARGAYATLIVKRLTSARFAGEN